ncbi:small secreted protein [Streptomyces sp. NPDC058691]|uniref:small secreted protein n=1 Tax=Streptomyces sp. NPDC058691 TaxID=3346601 RepID=UPI00366141D1
MKTKLAAALPATALILATGTLAGCGDNGNEKLDSWAKTVCTQAAAQVKKINDANAKISNAPSNGKPIEVRRADSSAFQQKSESFKLLADTIDKAGAPPVENGATLQKNVLADLRSLSTSYGNLRKQVDALPVTDQADFAEGLKGVSTSLDKINTVETRALRTLSSGEVGTAMAKQPGCQAGGAAPTKS